MNNNSETPRTPLKCMQVIPQQGLTLACGGIMARGSREFKIVQDQLNSGLGKKILEQSEHLYGYLGIFVIFPFAFMW